MICEKLKAGRFIETELNINIEESDPIISRVDAWFTEFFEHAGMSEEEAWELAIKYINNYWSCRHPYFENFVTNGTFLLSLTEHAT